MSHSPDVKDSFVDNIHVGVLAEEHKRLVVQLVDVVL